MRDWPVRGSILLLHKRHFFSLRYSFPNDPSSVCRWAQVCPLRGAPARHSPAGSSGGRKPRGPIVWERRTWRTVNGRSIGQQSTVPPATKGWPERTNSSCPSAPEQLGTPKRRKIPLKLSPRSALYARVSRDQQAQHDTIASQLAAVQAFATARGVRIDPDLIFADNGSSGTTLARPKLDALRDKAAAGEIEQLLILHPERRARKYTHQLLVVEELKKLGVTITFVKRQSATSPADQVLLQMQGVMAECEREKIVERHRRGKLHKAQPGKVCVLSGAP
jgi:predicted site-specific integrase-resolvase